MKTIKIETQDSGKLVNIEDVQFRVNHDSDGSEVRFSGLIVTSRDGYVQIERIPYGAKK